MPTFWCPFCWHAMASPTEQCPVCCADLARYTRLPYEEKLLLALRHPIAENRMIAIEILGRIGYAPAVPLLARVLREDGDPYLLRAAVVALARIGNHEARALLEQATSHVSVIVRQAAAEALTHAGDYPPNRVFGADRAYDHEGNCRTD